jgi:hypothetical protein
MKKNLPEKVLYLITTLLIITTFLLSLSFSTKNSLYLFLLVFGIIYWQKKRFQEFFQKIQNPKIAKVVYVLTGWLWAIFLELNLGLFPFHPKPIANYLVGIGFYLPYFAIWLVLIKRYQFTSFEIFYLSGLSRLIFDLIITRKLLTAAFVATNVLSVFLIVATQAIVTLVLLGVLTALPSLFLADQERKSHNKPLKEYLIGLTPNFLATGVFIVWVIILKTIFT